jgi:hypothetical protein
MAGFVLMLQAPAMRTSGWDARILILVFLCGMSAGYTGLARKERLGSLPGISLALNIVFLILGFLLKSSGLE